MNSVGYPLIYLGLLFAKARFRKLPACWCRLAWLFRRMPTALWVIAENMKVIALLQRIRLILVIILMAYRGKIRQPR
jgi:hypothetical protein